MKWTGRKVTPLAGCGEIGLDKIRGVGVTVGGVVDQV